MPDFSGQTEKTYTLEPAVSISLRPLIKVVAFQLSNFDMVHPALQHFLQVN